MEETLEYQVEYPQEVAEEVEEEEVEEEVSLLLDQHNKQLEETNLLAICLLYSQEIAPNWKHS